MDDLNREIFKNWKKVTLTCQISTPIIHQEISEPSIIHVIPSMASILSLYVCTILNWTFIAKKWGSEYGDIEELKENFHQNIKYQDG